jgi:hypothetical protein
MAHPLDKHHSTTMVASRGLTTVAELHQLMESFPEQALARLRRKLFRPVPELRVAARQLRLAQKFPPHVQQPFRLARNFPQ